MKAVTPTGPSWAVDHALVAEADADAAVADLEPDQVVEVGDVAVDRQPDLSLLRELDRVREQVHQHLLGTQWVGLDVTGNQLVEYDLELQALLRGPRAGQRHDVGGQLREIALQRFDRYLLGLDLRDVQDVVDDRQQVLPVSADRLGTRDALVMRLPAEAASNVPDLVFHCATYQAARIAFLQRQPGHSGTPLQPPKLQRRLRPSRNRFIP